MGQKEKTAKISNCVGISDSEFNQITDEVDNLMIKKDNFVDVLDELSECMASKNDFVRGLYLGRKIEKAQRLNKYFEGKK